MRDKMDI